MRARSSSMPAIAWGGALTMILALGFVNGEITGAGALAQDPTGACCQAGTCTQKTSAACLALPGVYHGNGVSCTPNPCQDLTGEICAGDSETIDGRVYCIMNGRLPDCWALQIDDLNNSLFDANLTSTPANANDRNLPAFSAPNPPCTSTIYKDWADLPISTLSPVGVNPNGKVENYRILDWTAAKDNTTLHGDCVTLGNAHPKEDFTQSYLANNDSFLYFAQERRTNNGNSTFYWLLTQEPPIINTSICTTGGDRGRLEFKLSPEDVRVIAAFSGGNSITMYTHSFNGAQTGYLPPSPAVFDSHWLEFAGVENLALSGLDGIGDGFAPWGGIDDQGKIVASGSFLEGELAEWAVDLVDVFGGASLCGKQLFVTGVSRASTGDPTKPDTSDLKDFIGPKLFSFGAIDAKMTLESVPCGDKFTYKVDVTGPSGPIDPSTVTVQWSCSTNDGHPLIGFDPLAISGMASVERHEDGTGHTVTCNVTVTAGGCEPFLVPDQDVEVQASLKAIIAEFGPQTKTCGIPCNLGTSQGTIPGGVTLAPVITGGTNSYDVSWSFDSGPGGPAIACDQPQPNPKVCTVHLPDSIYCARIAVVVHVSDAINTACVQKDFDLGSVRKATILQFGEPEEPNLPSCSVGPPICCTPGVNCP